jgi:hypothetical protein
MGGDGLVDMGACFAGQDELQNQTQGCVNHEDSLALKKVMRLSVELHWHLPAMLHLRSGQLTHVTDHLVNLLRVGIDGDERQDIFAFVAQDDAGAQVVRGVAIEQGFGKQVEMLELGSV